MPNFCPAYPVPRPSKAGAWRMFFSARRSWLDALYEKSYAMHMGEVHLPGIDLYMVNQPELVRRVLADEAEQFPKSDLLGAALQPLLGQSIFTTHGAQWKRQRQMMEPAFAQARLNVAFPLMRDAVRDMLARLHSAFDHAPAGQATQHDLEIEMTHVTADIIFRSIFSQPLQGFEARRIFAAFARYQALAPRLMLPSLFGLRWLVWPWDLWRSRRAAREIRGLLEALIRPRHDLHLAGGASGKSDILDAFMQARDAASGQPFGFDELVDQVAMLFLAGHETSASALTWACHLLAQSPQVQQRVHEEAQALQAASSGKDLQPGDMKGLELTWNVFRETLRLFPPVGFIARQSAQTCPMRDKTVRAGSTVVVSPWLIQRQRNLWQRPDEFDPDRYQNDASRESLRQAYLPFGMGPRVCMGTAFAQQEAALILSSLLREFRLEPVPGHVPQPVGRLTIRSANGVRLRLLRRGAGQAQAAA